VRQCRARERCPPPPIEPRLTANTVLCTKVFAAYLDRREQRDANSPRVSTVEARDERQHSPRAKDRKAATGRDVFRRTPLAIPRHAVLPPHSKHSKPRRSLRSDARRWRGTVGVRSAGVEDNGHQHGTGFSCHRGVATWVQKTGKDRRVFLNARLALVKSPKDRRGNRKNQYSDVSAPRGGGGTNGEIDLNQGLSRRGAKRSTKSNEHINQRCMGANIVISATAVGEPLALQGDPPATSMRFGMCSHGKTVWRSNRAESRGNLGNDNCGGDCSWTYE